MWQCPTHFIFKNNADQINVYQSKQSYNHNTTPQFSGSPWYRSRHYQFSVSSHEQWMFGSSSMESIVSADNGQKRFEQVQSELSLVSKLSAPPSYLKTSPENMANQLKSLKKTPMLPSAMFSLGPSRDTWAPFLHQPPWELPCKQMRGA